MRQKGTFPDDKDFAWKVYQGEAEGPSARQGGEAGQAVGQGTDG